MHSVEDMIITLTNSELEFLSKELKTDCENVQDIFNKAPRTFMKLCLDIIDEENDWDEVGDSRFDYWRRETAENILAMID